ncbi:hypothetical protein [Rhizobium leucaenae]|uniref:Uncharacterized protein n=1 Tax=Rhizobium leucaenae TaxID=29450 RepID=A0A7W7EPK2_9HYPH|nr:hypothetical protein [Rhizobium leucaenae]MBB4571323.1 hypothetical protein [Rhizobium leucaenae]MBB6305306.1 hypothetical protein [Rhizobium leucaenae]
MPLVLIVFSIKLGARLKEQAGRIISRTRVGTIGVFERVSHHEQRDEYLSRTHPASFAEAMISSRASLAAAANSSSDGASSGL